MTLYVSMRTIFCFFFIIFHIFYCYNDYKGNGGFCKKIIGRASVFYRSAREEGNGGKFVLSDSRVLFDFFLDGK